MPPPPRKCSKEGCNPNNVNPDLTWHCFSCKRPIHLLCYGVVKAPEDIFINDNITMVCDECLENPKETSPKRKQANLIQSAIDVQKSSLSLTKTVPFASAPSKNVNVKQNHQFQTIIESLVEKVKIQTATIAGLQVTVETMNNNILHQKETVAESIKVHSENISTITKSLNQTPNLNRKKTYADAAKAGLRNVNEIQTPKSSRPKQTSRSTKPVLTGTSNNVIGKPISPSRPKAPPKPEKAIWLSRMHRDTSEGDLANYIKTNIGIETPDITVRKLVKKDVDISSYSFVSFRITCSLSNFTTLMNPM